MIRKHFERLPTNIIPKHYSVRLTTVDLEKHTFEGRVMIQVIINQSTKNVKLNASELVLSEAKFQCDKESIQSTEVKLNADEETVDIAFESPLDVGEGQIDISFKGILHEKMKGFYRCKQADGVYGACTHFEPTATFDVSLKVPQTKTALSNMNVREETIDKNGFKTIDFQTTPRMSTYLVAFAVGDFDFVEDIVPASCQSHKDLTVRVYNQLNHSPVEAHI